MEIVNHLIARAEEWCVENGLKGPFSSSLRAHDFGFVVEVQGSNGSAVCTLTKEGRLSMYQRAK